ncbi:MAG TPA: transglycosylase domain-containing protein, partial [Patescibacteria group bacterium]|nr:transglycosylase domain-containing protein [Patescibacteria group bacterium]
METAKKRKTIPWKFYVKEISLIFLYVFLMLPVLFLGSFAYLMAKTPLGNSLETRKIAQTSIIYDRTGQHILYEIHGDENRKIISHNEIPDNIRIATIAGEDDRFYHHFGIDIPSVVRAVKTDIETRSLSQGASTITQQLARNVYLSRDKTFRRKILEAVYAVKLEKKYSKDEILDAYLNQVPYGSNASGIEAASETYFQKPAKDLTVDEAAMLAALTKATTYYSPYGNHKDELVKRQKMIIRRIGELKLKDPQTVEDALNTDTLAKLAPYNEPIDAPHFVFYTRDFLEKKYGKQLVEQGGLKIYTTLDWDKQKLAEKVLSDNIPQLKKFGAENAALTAVDPKTGQILVMAGSVDYFSKTIDGQVNVTTSPRQPGSSFKPIVYAKAFEDGYQPETLVLDATT